MTAPSSQAPSGCARHVALGEEVSARGRVPLANSSAASVERRLAQVLRVVVGRDRVQVDDAEEARRPAPACRRSAGSRRCSCRGASRPSAGCPKRSACRPDYREAALSWIVAVSGSPELMIVIAAGATADQTEPCWPRPRKPESTRSRRLRGLPPLVYRGRGERELLRDAAGRRGPRVRASRQVTAPSRSSDYRPVSARGSRSCPDVGRARRAANRCRCEGRPDRRASSASAPSSYREQTLETARAGRRGAGADAGCRGGAFKPRTSPYTFQGLGEEALPILSQVPCGTGLAGRRRS